MTHLGEVVARDAVPPIISREEWAESQAVARAANTSPGKDRGRRPKRPYLFTGGLLRCGRCGSAMRPRSRKAGAQYECIGRLERGPESCEQGPVSAEQIDRVVTDWFLSGPLFDLERTRADYEARAELALGDSRELLMSAESEVSRLASERERIATVLRGGDLSAKNGDPLLDAIEQQRPKARTPRSPGCASGSGKSRPTPPRIARASTSLGCPRN